MSGSGGDGGGDAGGGGGSVGSSEARSGAAFRNFLRFSRSNAALQCGGYIQIRERVGS
jgi:hypothetical protein